MVLSVTEENLQNDGYLLKLETTLLLEKEILLLWHKEKLLQEEKK